MQLQFFHWPCLFPFDIVHLRCLIKVCRVNTNVMSSYPKNVLLTMLPSHITVCSPSLCGQASESTALHFPNPLPFGVQPYCCCRVSRVPHAKDSALSSLSPTSPQYAHYSQLLTITPLLALRISDLLHPTVPFFASCPTRHRCPPMPGTWHLLSNYTQGLGSSSLCSWNFSAALHLIHVGQDHIT